MKAHRRKGRSIQCAYGMKQLHGLHWVYEELPFSPIFSLDYFQSLCNQKRFMASLLKKSSQECFLPLSHLSQFTMTGCMSSYFGAHWGPAVGVAGSWPAALWGGQTPDSHAHILTGTCPWCSLQSNKSLVHSQQKFFPTPVLALCAKEPISSSKGFDLFP